MRKLLIFSAKELKMSLSPKFILLFLSLSPKFKWPILSLSPKFEWLILSLPPKFRGGICYSPRPASCLISLTISGASLQPSIYFRPSLSVIRKQSDALP